jgi:membrane-bound serine protease (ClpP class)
MALGALLLAAARGAPQVASAAAPEVVLVPIEGTIDLGLAPFVERALSDAARRRASLVLLDIDTLGGRVDAAVTIRDLLLESSVPTAAFIHPRAISAGALIALASEKIVVATGATIGAATPVILGQPGTAEEASEKTLSYVRKEFRATADARGRPGRIAEAMVDPDVVIDGLIEAGKLLTMTTDEALAHGVADARADDIAGALAALSRAGAQIHSAQMNWAERTVRFLTQPVLASVLMTLGMLGLAVELRTPGLGLPGLIGALSLGVFFWGHAIVRLVGWEQLVLIGVGLVLLLLELLVIPGFGVAGILGLLALGAGLVTSQVGEGASIAALVHVIGRVVLSTLVALAFSLLALRYLPRAPGGHRLVLSGALPPRAPSASEPSAGARGALQGARGMALTPFRPAGIASIGARRVDAISSGEPIGAGEPIEVLTDDGLRVVVRRIQPSNEERST